MVRYLLSLNWNDFVRSTIIAAFEAYGSALVGIAPLALCAEDANRASKTQLQVAPKG